MEKVKLPNGGVINCIVSENETYKFYECGVHSDAADVKKALVAMGNECAIDFNSTAGWYVRVRKPCILNN